MIIIRRRILAGSSKPTQIGDWSWAIGTGVSPPAHAIDDRLIAIAHTGATSTSPVLPAGWTDIPISNLGSNSPGVRVAYKIATSNAETCTGFTNAQHIHCGVFRNITTIEDNDGVKQSSTSSTVIDWVGFPSLTAPSLIVGYVGCAGLPDPALRSDLIEMAFHSLTSENSKVRLGLSSGLVSTWPAATSVKTLGSTNGRAMTFELALR